MVQNHLIVCVWGGGFVLQKGLSHKISGLKGAHAAEGLLK